MDTIPTNLPSAGDAPQAVHVVGDHGASGLATPIITLESLQRYVETERSRTRQALLWTSTLFLFVVLLVLIMFLSVGIHVLRRSRETSDLVGEVRTETQVQAVKIDAVSDRVARVADVQEKVREVVEEVKEKRTQETEAVRANLERFGKWVVTSGNAREERALAAMEARVRQMESQEQHRDEALSTLRQQYTDLQASLTNMVAQALVSQVAASSWDDDAELEVATREEAVEAFETGLTATTDVEQVDLPSDSFPDNWMDGALASAEDIILSELGVLEGRAPEGEISVVTFPDGDRYEGEFKDGLFHGWGVYYYRNGDRYEGEFVNDMKSGRGTMTHRNGDKYVGEFKDDMKEGRGSFLYVSGDRYVGTFANDMRSGKGTIVYQTGNKYSGDFRNGLKHGNGIFRFDNGDIYKGEFSEDIRHGNGTYIYSGGARYIGQFVEGKRQGKGRYVYEGGEEYLGEFKQGRKDGRGVCIYPNGMRLKGLWQHDRFLRRLD